MLSERFDFASVDVYLRYQPDASLLHILLEESIGSFELSVSGLNSFPCCDDLEVSPSYRKHDQISRINFLDVGPAFDYALTSALSFYGAPVDSRQAGSSWPKPSHRRSVGDAGQSGATSHSRPTPRPSSNCDKKPSKS